MPRDPRDTTTTSTEKVYRRLGEADDQKEPIRLRVGAGPAGATGKEGPKGEDGEDGTDGAVWYAAAGAPSEGTGISGDFYLNTSNEDVYKKTGSTWNFVTNIKGEKGDTGSTGASGKEGPAGSAENNDWKNSVRAATTANIATATALNPGDSLDGVTLAENDRVLVKDQTTKSQNGIWVVKATPARALDADAVAELSGGSTIYVEEGTRNKRRTFQIITPGNITPGTTAHEYQQLGVRDFGIVEALPTSEAVKGDRCTYVADKTNGILWELIYDGEGEYPWKKIGGPPLYNEIETDQETASATYVALTTAGPAVTVPLKGDYDIEIGCGVFGGGTGNKYMSYAIGASAASDADGYRVLTAGSTVIEGSRRKRKTALAATTALTAKYRCTSGAAAFGMRWMIADPVRVG